MKLINEQSKGIIIGVDSQIGKPLFEKYRTDTSNTIYGTTRNVQKLDENIIYFDLTNSTTKSIDCSDFDFLIFCASITDIDYCEKNWDLVKKINIDNTIQIIDAAVKANCFVLFLSSNAVFDGTKEFYLPSDKVSPITNYGKSKAIVEEHILKTCGNHACVLRLTKVITENTPFILKWRYEASEYGYFSVYKNKFLSPVAIEDVVKAIISCVEHASGGIYQLSSRQEVSYLTFALELFKNDKEMIKKIKITDDCSSEMEKKFNSLVTYLP